MKEIKTAVIISVLITSSALGVWKAEVGPDGRMVNYGPTCELDRGPDMRMVCIPDGWEGESGPDGRMVAIPPNSEYTEGPDGHIVPLPPDDYRLEDYEIYYFILRIQAITAADEAGDDD